MAPDAISAAEQPSTPCCWADRNGLLQLTRKPAFAVAPEPSKRPLGATFTFVRSCMNPKFEYSSTLSLI